MLDFERRFLALLDVLHDAPGKPLAWMAFLEALRDAVSSDACAVFSSNPQKNRPGIVAGSGIGLRLVPHGDFLRPSVPHPATAALPPGAVRDLATERFESTALYREALAPAGLLPGPGLVVPLERDERHVKSALLLLPRTPGWKPTPADRALVERLAPHMVLARRLHVRLVERRHDTEALLSAFDHLALGVVLLAADGRVTYANRSAGDALGLAPGFGEPSADAADARTEAWQRLVGPDRDWSRDAVVLRHPDDGRPLQLVAAPFGWSGHAGPLGRRFARAVFIGDPQRRTGDPIGVLHEIYGLTPGETRLTLLLLADCSLEQAATLLDISSATARSVLKRIFEKTGANRQSALVRLLLAGFAQVRPEQPEGERAGQALVQP
jgi:DNA-binding CsgD family transcriptional regulator